MATETDIPESVSSKKGEKEDNALSSELLEETVTELPCNKVKHLQSKPDQLLENSSHEAETVNKQPETNIDIVGENAVARGDIRTTEGGIFSQAPGDENSTVPESCEATTTEDQAERKMTEIEPCTEVKPNDDEKVEVFASKEPSANEHQPNAGDHIKESQIEVVGGCGISKDAAEAIHAQTKVSIAHVLGSTKGLEKDIEVTECSNKDESMGDSPNTKREAVNEEDLQGKKPGFVRTRESLEEDTEEIRPSVETEETTEQQGMLHAITTDVCISPQTKYQEEITEDEEKNEEKATESDDGPKEKSDNPSDKEVCEDMEKAESKEELKLSDSSDMKLNDKAISILGKDEEEKEQALNMSEKDQGENDVTSSQDAAFEEELQGKIFDGKGKEPEFVKTRESIEEGTEKSEQHELHAITDVCISPQTESREETTEEEEKNEEETIESDDGCKKKSYKPSIKEVCEEIGLENAESEEGIKLYYPSNMKLNKQEISNLGKDEDQEKEQELNMLKKDQGENYVTSSQDAVSVEDLQAKKYDGEGKEPEFVKTRESMEEDTEKLEQHDMLHAITTAVCISPQADPREETTKNEEKSLEEDMERDDGQEKYDNPSVKEVCEETLLEKAESEEGIKLSDSSNMKLNEKAISILDEDEDQEKDQELNISTEDQGEGDVTNSQDATSVEDLQGKNYDAEGKEPKFVKTGESIEEDTEKSEQHELLHVITTDVYISTPTESREDTTENEKKNEEEAIESDGGRKEMSDDLSIKEASEETCLEKVETEEGIKLSDSSNTKLNEKAISISGEDEDQEKEQELNMSTKNQSEDDVTSSQDATSVQDLKGKNYDVEGKEPKFVKAGESIEEDIEKSEQHELLHAITTNVCISPQTESQEETTEHEEKNEEAIESDDGCKEKSDKPSIKEVCEEIGLENVESEEGIMLSDPSNMKLNEKEISDLGKDEDQEKEQELNMLEKDQGEDDVTSSQDAASVEDLQGKNYDGEGKEPEFVKTRESTEEVTEELEQHGMLHAITTDVCISPQTYSREETTKNEEKSEEEAIESDGGRKEKSDKPSVKEVCEETLLGKALSEEGIKLSDNSNMKLNEKAISILGKDEDQEKEKELNMSTEDQGENDVTSSEDAASVEDLQGKIYDGEGKEPEFVKTGESIDEDTVTIDVCISPPTESREETIENEEKIEEEAIESDDGRKEKFHNPSIKEVSEETGLENAESEEWKKLSDTSNMKQNEKAISILGKDEDQEKEQEFNMSEKYQGEDDVKSSQDAASVEDLQGKNHDSGESQEESQETTKDEEKSEEEAIGITDVCYKSIDAQEANEQRENEANNKREQEPEECANVTVYPCSEIEQEVEGNIKEEEADVGKKKEEAKISETELVDEDFDVTYKVAETETGHTKDDLRPKECDTEDDKGLSEGTHPKESDDILVCSSNATVPQDVGKDEILGNSEPRVTGTPEETSCKQIEEDERTQLISSDLPSEKIDLVHVGEDARLNENTDFQNLESKYEADEASDTKSNERKWSDINREAKALEQPEKSYITQLEQIGGSNSLHEKRDMEEDVTPENQLNNIPYCSEIVKDVILTEEVPLEIRKEKEINDIEEQIVEGDSYYTELQKKSAQNQKEIADEISYSDPIPVGNPEVTEVRVDTQKGQDLQAADDISCEPKSSSTIGASKPDLKEGTGQSVRISGEVKHCSVEEAPKEERSPALEDVTTSEPQVNLSNIESIDSPSESEKLPNQALESVCDEQSPKVVANSEDSKVKEECLVLATAKYTDENNVEEEHEIIANEISSAEKKEHKTESKQIAEHPSMLCPDAVLIEEELGRSSEHEIATDEGRSVMDPHQDTIADRTFSESCQPDTDEEIVKQAPTNSDEAKRSDTNAEEKALTEEDLEPHGELKPTLELVVGDQINETTPQLQKSNITTDNNVKCQSLESQLEHTSEKDSKDGKKGDMEDDGKLTPENQINSTQDLNETKNEAITTEEVKQVSVVIQKENERNEFKEETVEEDSCSKELQKTSNQKEKANEISYIDPIPMANPEVTETRANSQTRQEDLNAEEDLNSESEAPSTTEASKTGMKEGIEQPVIIIGEVNKDGVNEQPKKERNPAQGDTMTLEPELNLSSIESPYPPPESEKLSIKALESGSNVQSHEIVPKSEDSEVKEEDVLATKEYRDNMDGKHETMADEISNEEKREQTTYSKQAAEHTSIVCLDAAFVKKELGRSNEHENITSEGRCFEDPYQDSSADRTISEACPQETKEENVKQAPMKSNEVKWSDTNIEAQALTEENLEPYGELKPTSDTAIEDEVNETMPQPEQSDIASESYMKYRTLESKLEHMNAKDLIDVKRDMEENVTLAPENQINSTNNQSETMKNAILTEEIEHVAAEIKKGRNEVKEQVSGEDSYPTEIETTSTSNQKELANEIAYIKQIPVGNYEVTEVRAESQIELENVQAAEDLSWLPKASSTVGASKMEMSEGTGQTVTILGEVKDDSIDEAPKDKRIPALEDAKALELQVNLLEPESTGAPSNGQDSMKLREGMPSSTQEIIEEKGILISQLTDREVLEEGAIENRKEAPDHEFEKKEKYNEPQYEIQTPEAFKTETKDKHQEAANDTCETLGGGLSSEKLLDELEEIGAEEDIEVIARGEEKAIEESYRDTVAQVTVHEYLSQKEEKLVSMVPHEELTSPMAEDQTNESVMETNKIKVDSSSKSNKDQNLEFMEEEFTKKISVDQRSAKEIEEEGQSNLHIENKEAKSGNEAVEDVTMNEVLLEVKKAKESKRIKDDINEEASCIHNQLTSTTDEVCQNKRFNSSPNELLETRGSVEDTKDLKLMAESLNLKAETFTVLKGPKEDMKQKVENTSNIVASEFERLENMLTEENIVKAEANKENEKVDRPDADDPTRTSCDSISNSREQDIEVKSEERRGQGDAHKLEEKPIEVSEITFKGHEIVPEGREVPGIITENLQEAFPKLLQEKHDPEITTTIEKIEDEIKDKGDTLVNMCLEETLLTSTKEVAIPSDEKTGNLQVSTLGSEIDKGKQNDPGELLNKERGAVQPQEQICNIKFVDSPSDVEIREQGELMHCGSQEPSEDEILLPQNDKKIEDSHILLPVEKEILQGVDKSFKEAPIIDAQKHDKSFDYPTKVRILDAVSNAECLEIEQQHLYTKEATLESINQENQSEQKEEADENIESEISSEKGPKQTIVHKEIANDILVMSGAEEEDRSNSLEDHSKEQEYYGEMTHQDLEAVEEPFQTAKLFDKVEKADPIDIQEETMAKGNLHEEETKERTSIIETTVNLHHREKGDETDHKGTTTEAAIPIEDVNNSDVELQCEKDVPVPMCASTRNPEVKSEDVKVSAVMDATADEPVYNKDPNNKTVESYEVEKEILSEDMHLKSTGDRNKVTEEVSGMKQEPFNLPLTRERRIELDAPLIPDTAATEGLEIPQKYVTDDLIKVSQIQPQIQKYEVSACTMHKQLPNKPQQNESTESKVLAGNIDASQEQGEPTAKSMNYEAEDLKATTALDNEQQCTSEVFKEDKMSDEREKSETAEPTKILFDDILHESTKGNSEVAENLIGEREPAQEKEDQQVDKEETGDSGGKTHEENEEEDNEENQNTGSCSDAPVMVEASKDMEVKVHKKSNNILSGVGSKVKHSIAKVKKAIIGKSTHPKPPSPKEREEVIT